MKRIPVFCLAVLSANLSFGAGSPQTVLELPPSAENCRNSEGDFARLEDGSILFVYSHYVKGTGGDHDPAHLASRISKDGGKTWSTQDETVVANEGGLNVMSVSLLRLTDGALALFYLRKNSETDCRPFMRVSRDEGKSWGAPIACVADAAAGYYVLNNGRAERLESGRIALPLCLHESKDGKIGDWAGKLVCALSDDDGVTWRLSGTPFATFDETGRRVTTQEPGLVQLKDGRVLMYARTDRGRQWFFYSSDGCRTWTKGEPGSLWGPLAPATVKRLKNGDLLAVWNDHENRPDRRTAGPGWAHGVRTPLVTAVSQDEGRTWIHRRILEDKSDGWYCYTAVLDCGESLLLGYCAEKMLQQTRLLRVSLDWIYNRPDVLEKYAFVPYGEAKTSTPTRIPSGCVEFDVDLPRPHGGPVVRAADYGLSESSTNNAAAINRALAAAKRLGAVRLELAPGTYRCHDSRGIVVDGFSDFTIEGCGAVLVFCRPPRIRPSVRQYDLDSDGGNLLIRNCTRVAVRRVSMDWNWAVDPLADFARVIARHVDEKDDASYVDLQLTDLERHPKYPAPVPVQIVGQMREDRTNIDGNGWGCGVGYAEGHFGSKNAWIAPNVLRVWPCVRQPDAFESPWYDKLFSSARNRRETAAMREGALVRIVHCYYGQNAVNMISNVHLTLEDFHIWACRGMGFNVQGAQHHWVLRRCSVALPTHLKGRRAITATADANHIVQSQGWCRFEDCAWSLHLDDMNNFHDRMTVGVKDGEWAIRLVNVRGNGYFQARPGDRIGLLEADYASVGWTGRLVRIDGETLVFDRPVPKERLECFQLFKADYATDNIIIRNCRFDDGFGRNLLQAHNLTIENCSFRRTTGAPICLMAEWTYNAWSEGRGVTNAVIRGCTFAENMIQCGAYDGLKADIFSGVRIRADVEGWVAGRKVAAPRPPSDRQAVGDILIEKCRFENPKGLCWHAARGANLIFRDNEIVLSKDDAAALPYRGSVLFEERRGVSVSGNRLISARFGATAGVYLPK